MKKSSGSPETMSPDINGAEAGLHSFLTDQHQRQSTQTLFCLIHLKMLLSQRRSIITKRKTLPLEAWTRRSIGWSGKMSHQLIKFITVIYQPFLTVPLLMLGKIMMHQLKSKLKLKNLPTVPKPSTPSMRRSTITSTTRRM